MNQNKISKSSSTSSCSRRKKNQHSFLLEKYSQDGTIASVPCERCNSLGEPCIVMEGVSRCQLCTKLKKRGCNAISLERAARLRDEKAQQLLEVSGEFDVIQQEIKERQEDLSKVLAKFHEIAAKLNRCQKELGIITAKYRESLAHAEMRLMEEDAVNPEDETISDETIEAAMREPLNYFYGDLLSGFDDVTAYNMDLLGASSEGIF